MFSCIASSVILINVPERVATYSVIWKSLSRLKCSALSCSLRKRTLDFSKKILCPVPLFLKKYFLKNCFFLLVKLCCCLYGKE